MSDDRLYRTSAETTRKWHALAVKQREHLVELYRTGRWRHYYTEEKFLAHMREAVRGVEAWRALAGSEAEPSDAPADKPSH